MLYKFYIVFMNTMKDKHLTRNKSHSFNIQKKQKQFSDMLCLLNIFCKQIVQKVEAKQSILY